MNQPLVLSISRTEKRRTPQGTVEEPEYIYLVPELLALTGMSDGQRSNHAVMKNLAKHTKM